MALTTVSSDRLSTNVKNTNFTAAEKQDLTDDILPLAGQLGNRNVIINGACQVAQRSNLVNAQTGYGAVDRFKIESNGASRFTLSQHNGPGAQYGLPLSLKFETLTADNSVDAGDYMYITHKFEGQEMQRFQKGSSDAKQFTLQFWIKLAVEGTYVVQLFDADNSRHVVANYTVSSANTWEKKIITFPADTTGSFDNDNARSLDVRWHFMGGSNYRGGTQQTTWGSIVATNMLEGMGNAVSSTGDNFITGMQLEVGPQATSFEHRSFGDELLLCRRYYRVFQDASGGNCYMGVVSYNYDVNSVVTQVNFSPEMRATPSLDNTSGTNYYRFYRNSGYVDINAMNAINGMTKYGGGFNNSDSGNGTAGQTGGISLNNSSAKIAFDAEL